MRRFFASCLAIVLAGPAAAPLQAAARPVAPGVRVLPGSLDSGRQPDANSVIFEGPDGVVVVDSGRHIEHAQALLDAVGTRPLVALVNTHWHLDHLGGNLVLRAARPRMVVYASSGVRGALDGWLADSRRDMLRLLADPGTAASLRRMVEIDVALVDAGARLLPDVVVGQPQPLAAAGLHLRLGLQTDAVTAGDVWVLDPRSRVLAAGDLVTLPVPFFDTACPSRWREALARLDRLDFALLVPGHGPVMTRADFGRWRGAYERLLQCAAGPAADADCSAGWIADLGPLLAADEHDAARRMLGYYLAEHLRAAPATQARFCPA